MRKIAYYKMKILSLYDKYFIRGGGSERLFIKSMAFFII